MSWISRQTVMRLLRVTVKAGLALLVTVIVSAQGPPESVAAIGTAPPLGTAGSFAVLAGSTATNTGPTIVNGDLGVSPGSAVTGFPPGVVVGGIIHAADAVAAQAQLDATTARNNLAGQACDTNLTGMDLGGMILTPGVYCFSTSAFLSAGTLTLNALGDPNAVFVFQIGSTLITGSGTSVVIINGGQECNVFWQVGSSATLGTTTSFRGNILALASVTLNTGATLLGRAFASVGAVTMDANVITRADCIVPGEPDVELDLTKTDSPDPVIAGQNLTYVLTVTNNGTDPAPNVTIIDNLPVGTVFVSATPSTGGICTLSGGNVVTCVWAGDTAPGGTRSVTIVVRVCPDVLCGTILVNTAVASADFGLPDPATTATTVGTRSDLSITKTRTSPVGPGTAGQNITYSIVVTNAGPSNSVNTIVTDILSANLQFVSATSTLGTCSAVGQTVTCTLGTLGAPGQCATTPVPQTATITLVARTCPEALCGSAIANTATVSGGNLACANNLPDPNTANNSSLVNTSVQTQSDLSIVKTQTSPAGNVVIAGQNVTYGIVVTNAGPSNSINTVVTDILSANLQFVSATSTQGTCSAVGQTVTCTIGSLGPVGITQCAIGTPLPTMATITLVARTCPETVCGAIIRNTASVTGGDPNCETFNLPDPTPANNTSFVDTTVQTRSDLSIVKTQTSPAGGVVIAGQNVTYSILVTNSGPSNSLNTVVTDILSANLQFVSASSTVGMCSAVGQTVTCNIGSLGPVGITQCTTGPLLPTMATITLVARTCPETVCGAIIRNTATVAGGPVGCASNLADPTPANNTSFVDTTVQTRSDLSITKSQTSPAGGVVIAGQNVTYSIVVSNAGPSNSINTVVTDILSAGLAFVSATSTQGTCSAVGQTVTCTIGSLGPIGITQCTTGTPLPTTATITLVARACPEAVCGGPIRNTATVTGGPVGCASNLADPTPANNTAFVDTTVQTRSDLSITKTQTSPAGGVVIAGQNVTYSIVVTNSGPSNSINTVVTDILPANLQFVSAVSTLGSCSAVGQTVTCTIGSMGPVGITQCTTGTPLPTVATITLVVRTCPEAACGAPIRNTATVAGGPVGCASNLADPTPANNTAFVDTTVQTRSDLSITKTKTSPPGNFVIAGQNVTYSVVVTNAGPSNSPNTVMLDTLPVQTSFVSATPTQGTCSHLNGVVTCAIGTLGPVGIAQCTTGTPFPTQVTITIVVNVPLDTPSSDPTCGCNGSPLTNVASVTGGTPNCLSQLPDPTPANNTASLVTQVSAGADVVVAAPEIAGPECFAAGDELTITQAFSNDGVCAVTDQPDGPGPEFEIFLPAGVVGQPGSCTVLQGGGTCTITANHVAWNGVIPVGATIILEYRVRILGGIAFGTEFCFLGQVHFDQCNIAGSGRGGTTTCAVVDCPSIIAPNTQLSNQVHLPILNFLGQDDVCESWIEVQNIGCQVAKAALITWGEPGFCPPQAAGPLKVECTGLLKPGSSWNLYGAQVPTGSKSGILFKLSGRQLSEDGIDVIPEDDITGDYVCEVLFFNVVGDADDYRRFKKAYDEGLIFDGIDMSRAAPSDGALAVDVHRTCPGDVTPGVDVTSKYGGIAGTHLGVYDDVYGGYGFYVPLVYASKAGYNSIIYIQNGGLMCSSIEIWFQQQEDCLRATICDIATLAPGETYQLDANDCVGPDFQGSAWIRSTQRMGIAVDIIGHDLLMTYVGEPSEINYTFDPNGATYTAGNQVGFAPLVYSEYQGWDSAIQVQNLSPVVAAKVKVYFLDRGGDIITTLIDWVCPRGSQTFFLPLVAALPGNWVGSARVESQEWISPGSPNVLAPNVVSVATLIEYSDAARTAATQGIAYNLLPEHKIFDWQIGQRTGGNFEAGVGLIAIPSVLKDLGSSGLTTEIAIANVVPKPGFTDLVIYLYDQNGLIDYICQKLNEKQVEYIDLQTWGWINNGFKGSAVISAWFWEHDVFDGTGFFLRNLVGLGAVAIERKGARLGEDVPGDEAAGDRGIPFANTYDEDGNPLFEYCFMGPLPLCPGFVDARPVACAVKQQSFACDNCPVTIPQLGLAPDAVVNVTGAALCQVADVDITLDIQHTWNNDIVIDVSSPAVADVVLAGQICGADDNMQAIVDSDAAAPLGSVCPPAGFLRYTPGGAGSAPDGLDAFDGRNPDGTWILSVNDLVGGDGGAVRGWSVDITYR
ncbi:MAG: DUF11 domain-containing protein [Ardenticatenales bacterium]|nr:DUF11 domain-containing protein [Ardenticatenales bacterium]